MKMNKKTKELERTEHYFAQKRVVMIDPQKSLRSTFKKVMRELGIHLSNIEIVEGTLDEIIIAVKKLRPHIMITPPQVHGANSLDFYHLQREIVDDEINRAFFIVSPQNSLSLATMVLDHELDGCISEPYTASTIKETITRALKPKIMATDFHQSYEKLRQTIRLTPDHVTVEMIRDLQNEAESRPEKIAFLEGEYWLKRNNLEKAEVAFEEAHCLSPKAYLPLKYLAETTYRNKKWDVAYEVRKRMLELFPINPESIPELIKLSVVNEHFDDVFHYLKLFDDLEERGPQLERHIAAGLALCGKFLLQNEADGDKERGVSALKRAVEMSQGQIEVIKMACTLFLEQGLYTASREIIDEYRDRYRADREFHLVEMQILAQSRSTLAKALKLGLELLSTGHRDTVVFENVIRLAIQLKRKPEFIRNLISEALYDHPSQHELFESLSEKLGPTEK